MKVLVVDIGGSHVKFTTTTADEPRRFDSGPELSPRSMMRQLREMTSDWEYEAVSVGYPGAVGAHGPIAEPGNLAEGWVGFDYRKAFDDKPTIVINDAAMQALGAYTDGRMLFLGLGTGLGSALVVDRVVVPMELGNLPYNSRYTMFERLGKKGLKRLGKERWIRSVHKTVDILRHSLAADHIVLGGGNSKLVDPLPEGCKRGGNKDAFEGGFRLWEERVEPHDQGPSEIWRVVCGGACEPAAGV